MYYKEVLNRDLHFWNVVDQLFWNSFFYPGTHKKKDAALTTQTIFKCIIVLTRNKGNYQAAMKNKNKTKEN